MNEIAEFVHLFRAFNIDIIKPIYIFFTVKKRAESYVYVCVHKSKSMRLNWFKWRFDAYKKAHNERDNNEQ